MSIAFTLLLAVVCARWARPRQLTFDYLGERITLNGLMARAWQNASGDRWPAPPDVGFQQLVSGARHTAMVQVVGDFDPEGLSTAEWSAKAAQRTFFSVDVHEFGWPVPCLALAESSERKGLAPVPINTTAKRLGDWLIPTWIGWGGLLIDVSAFAIGMALLYFAPQMIRRSTRTFRGRCPKCGYDLRGNFAGGCSECGWRRTGSVIVTAPKHE